MISIEEKSHCSGCHACTNACPKNCIQMISDDEGFWYPQVDNEKCINCGLCENVCPITHKWHPDDSRTTTAMAAISLNEEIRLKSSSGGIFTLIAEEMLKRGGVVFGAAFADDFKSVHHIYIDNSEGLERLRGSKYVQSKIGDTYKQAQEFLDNGRMVLFTGTPCQIGGLYSYLRKPYKNLFTQDIICHGVPSPMVWEKYVDEREKKSASKTQRMFFRHKKYGWKTFAVLFEFSNNTAYIKNLLEDSYMRIFLSNACLRPSCYDCTFKLVQRQADITLADFWGVQNVLPEMDDNKGTSLVITHSSKGKMLISTISDSIISKATDINIAKKYNFALIESAKTSVQRNNVLNEMQSCGFDELVDKYFHVKTKTRLISFLTRYGLFEPLMRLKLRLKKGK